MSISRDTYKALAIPFFKEVFEMIDFVMKSHGHPYYLIGANAMAIELLKEGIKPVRGTKDIDFAVMLSDIQQYDEIIIALVKNGFNEIKEIPHRVYHPEYKVAVDILPFGQIEQNYTVKFSDRLTELHVLGFTQVLEDTREVRIGEITISIPTLPGMVLLKLIAWQDKPDRRTHDLADILHIFKNYFSYNYDEIVEHHHDTFLEEESFDQLKIAAQIIGRKLKPYLLHLPELENKVKTMLDQSIEVPENSRIAIEWARHTDSTVEYIISVLQAFRKGMDN